MQELTFAISNCPEDYLEHLFCPDITHAHTSGRVLDLIAIDQDIFVARTDIDSLRLPTFHADYHPSVSLYDLLSDGSFEEPLRMKIGEPLKKRNARQRFHWTQKRSLAAHLALSLSFYLGSKHTLKIWDPKEVFLPVKSGQLQRKTAYAFTTSTDDYGNARLEEANETYIALARLLLDIEYATPRDHQLTLDELKKWVHSMLCSNNDENPDNLGRIIGQGTFLKAIHDLLNFEQTYKRESRWLRGRFNDIATIAKEILLTNVAQKIRSTFVPTYTKPSAFRKPTSGSYLSISASPWPEDCDINWDPQPSPQQKLQTSAIQLFDEIDGALSK